MNTKFIILIVATVIVICAIWWRIEERPEVRISEEQKATGVPTERSPASVKDPHVGGYTTAGLPKRIMPVLNLAEAPSSIRAIVDVRQSVSERFQSARLLGKKLSRNELDFLYTFLRERHAEDDTQTGHALKSDVMDGLCNQRTVPKDLSQLLIDVFQDRTQNVVIRDYALQHLPALYERLEKPLRWPSAQLETQKTALQQVIWDALVETDSSVAGTALIGLCRLAEIRPEFDKNRIGTVAFKMVEDLAAGDLTRVTALQVCARLQVKDALPLLAKTAEKESDISLRISAIAGIGLLGGKNEVSLLERISSEENPRLAPSLKTALRRIQEQIRQ